MGGAGLLAGSSGGWGGGGRPCGFSRRVVSFGQGGGHRCRGQAGVVGDPPDDRVAVSIGLFQPAESDLTSPRGGPARVKNLAQDATGRLTAIADAAEEVYRALDARLGSDEVQMDIAVAISAELGWFVAKSEATGSLKLTFPWKRTEDATQAVTSDTDDGSCWPGMIGWGGCWRPLPRCGCTVCTAVRRCWSTPATCSPPGTR